MKKSWYFISIYRIHQETHEACTISVPESSIQLILLRVKLFEAAQGVLLSYLVKVVKSVTATEIFQKNVIARRETRNE